MRPVHDRRGRREALGQFRATWRTGRPFAPGTPCADWPTSAHTHGRDGGEAWRRSAGPGARHSGAPHSGGQPGGAKPGGAKPGGAKPGGAKPLATEHRITAVHRDLLGRWNTGTPLTALLALGGAGQGDAAHRRRWRETYGRG
ncbi:hypothetical protein ACF06N_27285 [Streptomyces albidoflavus]